MFGAHGTGNQSGFQNYCTFISACHECRCARIREMNLNGAGQFEIEEIPNSFFAQVYADEFKRQMEAPAKRMKGKQAPRTMRSG